MEIIAFFFILCTMIVLMKGFDMGRLKKIAYFVGGLFVIPLVLGRLLAVLLNCDDYVGIHFFGLAYFIIYLIFPLFYNSKIGQYFHNRYAIYSILYLPFILLFVWLYM